MQSWIIKAQQDDPEAFQELMRHFSGMAHAVSNQKLCIEAYLAYLSRLSSEPDGIGSVEREVMKEIAAGEHSPDGLFRKVGNTLHQLGMGDLEFWYVLRTMAERSQPLIMLEGVEDFKADTAGGASFKNTSISLTKAGLSRV
ncbi:hypothetical protein [Paenibacillus gallinarum]|uniref:Uncharacterized protein n=1 Tax=Paenibacillus gallinarum TaxID=2762232 RepID=A0ABR8T4A9_9BACL|nr:hypothetical protein [Paenibacillus gallinarum]MBD7970583.1 hypothetical protein [Paenibacillus gallinarum]